MQIKKWLLLIGMLFITAGCSLAASSTGDRQQESFELAEGESLSSLFMEKKLPDMKGIAESDSLRLFVGEETGDVAVMDKSTGKTYYTNPPERTLDKVASGINAEVLSAQLNLDYYNQYGQLSNINSFTDSVAYEQISMQSIEKGIRVNYKFGNDKNPAEDLPMMLSYERYKEITSQMDKTGQRALMIGYKEDKEKKVYIRNDDALKGLQLDRALQAFESIGYTEEDLLIDTEEHNITKEETGTRAFLVSIEYVLDKDSLVVRIPKDSIQFPENYPINKITPLSFFGAAGVKEEGSIFIPDGSGALIHFNSGKINYPAYKQDVYGVDQTMETTNPGNDEQNIRLPVFGMIYEEAAFLGVIEEGAAAATINADISGRLNSYNYVHPSFYVVKKDEVILDANGQRRSLPKFQQEKMSSDFVIRYKFLPSEQASYQGLAHAYQSYLLEHNKLLSTKFQEQENSPFYLDLVGGITLQKHILGVPYNALESLTTFKQAEEMIDNLEDKNIRNIKLNYSGWFNGGLDQKIPDNVKVDKVIGGSKSFKDFIKYTDEKNIEFYPGVSLTQAHSTKGFNKKNEAARNLREIPAALYPRDLALDKRDVEKKPSYLVKPDSVKEYTASFLNGVESYALQGIALEDLTNMVNSDFNKKRNIDRIESEQIMIESISLLKDLDYKIMANDANAYALPYVSLIKNAPMSNSGFKIEDESIPFYQMVLRGYVDYTGSPYNLSPYTNDRQYVLKCLEYGAGVHFKWIYKPNYLLKDTEHNNLFAVNYELWLDQSIELYQEVNDFLKEVQGEGLIKHEKLADNVYQSTYSNGLYVIVNYNAEEVEIDGKTIKPEGYIIGGDQI
ncbi:hypothetical protein J2Z23_000374 [Lederbergia galactosidilyticus]|uniref:DUF5696 domain-containing protein n=1 Tax=Lederbergia galactosidilytica TaxID=217031 RepID=UPI001AE727AA|nr:DUF5696 domain-containing protein [Lederbergia galactosidilytica]MBP1913442.1 hypothetical protein [Lederbergia galactosidilytica]